MKTRCVLLCSACLLVANSATADTCNYTYGWALSDRQDWGGTYFFVCDSNHYAFASSGWESSPPYHESLSVVNYEPGTTADALGWKANGQGDYSCHPEAGPGSDSDTANGGDCDDSVEFDVGMDW